MIDDRGSAAWAHLSAAVQREIGRRQLHPAEVVVLLPYVQLIPVARAAWMRAAPAAAGSYFMPRFETTLNWSRTLGGFVPGTDDLLRDPARDLLTSAALLARAGHPAAPPALVARLMEVAWSVAPLAAAVAPAERIAWGERTLHALQDMAASPFLEWESRLGQVALAWAAHSAYATDVLFRAQAKLLVLVEGLQRDPMHAALQRRWGAHAVTLPLALPAGAGQRRMHQAMDAEDEAERASAAVLDRLLQGHAPVALVAHDRVLTRRVSAMLAQRGVAVRDETGWTLSTTRAAAAVVGLLRAAAPDASTDAVLEWAKQLPAVLSLDADRMEQQLRRGAARDWRSAAVDPASRARVDGWRADLQLPRGLSGWLRGLRATLQACGQWSMLLQDSAGQAVIDALHLHEHADGDLADAVQVLTLAGFAGWVGQVLEAGSFVPPHPEQAQVVILPLSQLLGRNVAAVVMPGCDENSLPASPDLPGAWTSAQRAVLGLPAREQLAESLRMAWAHALAAPQVDILWRASDAGETVMPSPLVQRLRLDQPGLAPDPRVVRTLHACPPQMPAPSAPALGVARLSASAYEDLRRCPYRFFALRMLQLQEAEELDTALDKRDFGNWLHAVLRRFHELRAGAPAAQDDARAAMLDQAAERASAELALASDEFLPFACVWPQVRAAYLSWLERHEAQGARFQAAEVQREVQLAQWTLIGRIDRIDRLPDGGALLIDYKTEARDKTVQRVRQPQEDTQLAFYAALLETERVEASYLSIVETEAPKAFDLPDADRWRGQLLQGIARDLGGIAAGAPLPAIGAGASCDFCAARGLCRKDFWSAAQPVPASP